MFGSTETKKGIFSIIFIGLAVFVTVYLLIEFTIFRPLHLPETDQYVEDEELEDILQTYHMSDSEEVTIKCESFLVSTLAILQSATKSENRLCDFDSLRHQVALMLVTEDSIQNESVALTQFVYLVRVEKGNTEKEILDYYIENYEFTDDITGFNEMSVHLFNKPLNEITLEEKYMLVAYSIYLPDDVELDDEELTNKLEKKVIYLKSLQSEERR